MSSADEKFPLGSPGTNIHVIPKDGQVHLVLEAFAPAPGTYAFTALLTPDLSRGIGEELIRYANLIEKGPNHAP